MRGQPGLYLKRPFHKPTSPIPFRPAITQSGDWGLDAKSSALLTNQKFIGLIPLYIGVELILAIAILNKAGGVYGLLSLLTGHHMNFFQWLYNLLAVAMLPFYISTLVNLLNRSCNMRKVCLGCSIYVVDTLIGLLFTMYFVYFWFSREDSSPGSYGSGNDQLTGLKRAYTETSQSASPSRELFLTVSGTLVTTAIRIYFCFVFLSYTKQLLRQSQVRQRTHGSESLDQEVFQTGVLGRVKKFVHDLEVRAKLFMAAFYE